MRILSATVLVLALAGCSLLPGSTAPTGEPVSSIPAKPATLFNGSCDNMISPIDLQTAVGGGYWIHSDTDYALTPNDQVLANIGGFTCGWSTVDGGLVLTYVFPADATTEPEDTSCGLTPAADLISSCAIDVTTNGIRMSGLYIAPAADVPTLAAVVASIESVFTEGAEHARTFSAPVRDESAWPAAVDCPYLDIRDFTAVSGPPLNNPYFPRAIESLTGGVNAPHCDITRTHPDLSLTFSVLGGGRWIESELRKAEGARVVAVEGLERVILVTTDGVTVVNVLDGVNWLQTTLVEDEEWFYPSLVNVIEALNA